MNTNNLIDKKGDTTSVASVELSNKDAASKYFGTWYKANASASDVVNWCDERIAIYKRFITNLETLQKESRKKMCEGMSTEDLQAIINSRQKVVAEV